MTEIIEAELVKLEGGGSAADGYYLIPVGGLRHDPDRIALEAVRRGWVGQRYDLGEPQIAALAAPPAVFRKDPLRAVFVRQAAE